MRDIKMPSIESIRDKFPSIDSMSKQLSGTFSSKKEQLPSIEDLTGNAIEKLNIPSIPTIPSKGELISSLLSKAGIELDFDDIKGSTDISELAKKAEEKFGIDLKSSMISEKMSELEEFKSGMKEKAFDGIKTLGSKIGIDVPNIPTQEELVNMIALDENIDENTITSKLDAIKQFINSKLES